MTDRGSAWHHVMRSRSTGDEHRASTPLELFFDLCFVVAVSQAAGQLHHYLVERDFGTAVLGFATAFFAVFWAWLNFTWFASAYDTDDAAYRVMVLVQIAGVLVLAAGVPTAYRGDTTVVVIGYVIMRIAQVGQWLRAAREAPAHRSASLRYAAGVTAAQVLWVARLALHGTAAWISWPLIAAVELAVPVWAEWRDRTSWHPAHIADRYGAFTLIVLGESVLAATNAVQQGFNVGKAFGGVLSVALGGLLTVFAMWWLYFDQPSEGLLRSASDRGDYRPSFLWGYGHYLIFASAAAVGAGLEVAVDGALGHTELSDQAVALTVAIPVAVYVAMLWGLHAGVARTSRLSVTAYPVAALVVLAMPVLGLAAIPAIGAVLAILVFAASPLRGHPRSGVVRAGLQL